MPGRHRQFVPPRVLPKRLVAAGASGVVTVLALAPLAHADAPADDVTTSAAPSSEAPTSADPSSDAPASEAPSSDAPSSSAPSSEAPTSVDPSSEAPSSDVPSAATPSNEAPTSGTPAPAAPSASTPSKKIRVQAAPSYGLRKIYVGSQLKDGNYYPAGTTTVGSTFEIVETGPSVPNGTKTTPCTTNDVDSPIPGSPGDSSCYPFLSGYQPASDSTVSIRQLTAAAGTLVDTMTFTSVPCVNVADADNPTVPTCGSQSQSASFTDAGLPPTVSDASQSLTAEQNGSVTLGPDSQIDRHGAPATSVDVDQPTHGTVTVNQAAAPAAVTSTPVTRPFTLTYTPVAGHVGPDSFRYRVTTANGTSGYATVSLRVVGAAPTAVDDTASTTSGDAVTVNVLGNDDANGGGTLALASVGTPAHGTATVDGSRVVYTPAADFTGTERFTYTVSTISGTASASISVRVTAPDNGSNGSDDGNGNDGTDDNGAGTNGTTESTADTGTPSAALLELGGVLLLAGAGAAVAGRHRRRGPA